MNLPGRAIGESRLLWRRGPARVSGTFVLLETARSNEYRPLIRADGVREGDLLVDLANLAQPGRSAERDGVRFAEAHGMLWAGPNAEQASESFIEWQVQATVLATTMSLYIDLNGLPGEPTPLELRRLRKAWERALEPFYPGAVSVTDEDFPTRMANALTSILNRGLQGTQERVDAAIGRDPDHGELRNFLIAFDPPDLLGAAYQQAALIVTGGVTMAVCADPKCSRFFHQLDRRARYCDPVHANRHRQRRFAAKHGMVRRTVARKER
jgi:hypothetical protein